MFVVDLEFNQKTKQHERRNGNPIKCIEKIW